MIDIELDPELQGKGQRNCCLADQLELQALLLVPSFSRAELADKIVNANWLRILEPRYTGIGGYAIEDESIENEPVQVEAMEPTPESLGPAQDKADEQAERVLRVHAQRKRILGDRYPFQIDGCGRLTFTGVHGPYLWLLSLSLIHGYRIKCDDLSASEAFEQTVTKAIGSLGMKSFTAGTSSGEGKLLRTLEALGKCFPNLVLTPENVCFPRSANDFGADTFGMFPFPSDNRHGHWVFVGQSTVAKSEEWEKKINEVRENVWFTCFSNRVSVVPFFATPYHADDGELTYLVGNLKRCILDRLRLTQILDDSRTDSDKGMEIIRSLRIA